MRIVFGIASREAVIVLVYSGWCETYDPYFTIKEGLLQTTIVLSYAEMHGCSDDAYIWYSRTCC